MSRALHVLQAAISDIGYWQHWDHRLPGSIQAQFGGVQLLTPPLSEGGPPAGQIALRFVRPTSVCFLTHRTAPEDLPPDWPERLQKDQLEPFDLTRGTFTLTDSKQVHAVLMEAGRILSAHGADPRFDGLVQSPVRLALWAGPVGLVIGAEEIEVHTHKGPIDLELIPGMHEAWWDYWRRYWTAKRAGAPLSTDYACEVTLPPEGHDPGPLPT